MNKPLNVIQLATYLAKEIKKGHGEYLVFVTDDEEANGYHGLWYKGSTAEELGECREDYENINHDLCCCGNEKEKAIYLG